MTKKRPKTREEIQEDVVGAGCVVIVFLGFASLCYFVWSC